MLALPVLPARAWVDAKPGAHQNASLTVEASTVWCDCVISITTYVLKCLLQVVKVPNSSAEDAVLMVQMGSLQVAVKVSEVQQKQV